MAAPRSWLKPISGSDPTTGSIAFGAVASESPAAVTLDDGILGKHAGSWGVEKEMEHRH